MSVSNTPSEKKVFASEDKQANDNPLERTEIHNYYSNFAVIKSDNDSVTFVKRTTAEYGPSSSKPAMYLGKESQLHQHLRLASTRPVGFAVEEAQVQVEEATQVRGGLIKKDENGKEFLAKAAALDKDKAFKEEIDAAEVELGQLNKNMVSPPLPPHTYHPSLTSRTRPSAKILCSKLSMQLTSAAQQTHSTSSAMAPSPIIPLRLPICKPSYARLLQLQPALRRRRSSVSTSRIQSGSSSSWPSMSRSRSIMKRSVWTR